MVFGTHECCFRRKRKMDESQVFMSNLQGSGAANILTGVIFLVFWFLKNKCKHLQCKSHTSFCSCSVKEDDENDLETGQSKQRRLEIKRQKSIKIPDKTKIHVRKLHKSKHHGVLPERSQAISTD